MDVYIWLILFVVRQKPTQKNFYSADLNKTAIQTDPGTCDLVFEHSQQSLPINFCLIEGGCRGQSFHLS